ncbi:SDR family NAD(P)-dependent oxidoreductase [Klebsiella aerogenes]|uniref:SDR family NAD(P)-dependent oxidoreductase n=1 Tax=Klebsiella aerogenes TaxID=548 RepID=UPI000A559ECF|nr:SDR family NAD(P)-dependent oxidoreductase [Klebsiella aerogenes]
MKYTLITGASSGIGKALSYQFASRGYNLIITARREDELQKLKQDIESRYAVQVIENRAIWRRKARQNTCIASWLISSLSCLSIMQGLAISPCPGISI